MTKAEKYKIFYEEKLQSGIDKFMVDGKLKFDDDCHDFVMDIAHCILMQESVPFQMSLFYQSQLFVFDDSALFASFLEDTYKLQTFTKKEYEELSEKNRKLAEKLLQEKLSKKESESD